MNNLLKIVFAGTSDFSVDILSEICNNYYNVLCVITKKDSFINKKKVSYNLVKMYSKKNNIKVIQPICFNLKDDIKSFKELDKIRKEYLLKCDIMIVVSYGFKIPFNILNIPKYGCVNIHTSLLPKWRGAAPIHRSIEYCDKQIGVTLIRMDSGLDTGEIISQSCLYIRNNYTVEFIYKYLISLSKFLLIKLLNNLKYKRYITSIPQFFSCKKYAKKINKFEKKIDWNKSSNELYCKINSFSFFSCCIITYNNLCYKIISAIPVRGLYYGYPGEIVVLLPEYIIVSCKIGSLCITKLKTYNGKILFLNNFISGSLFSVGKYFKI